MRPDARRPSDRGNVDLGLLVAASGLTLLGILMTTSATKHVSGSAFLVRGSLNALIAVALAAWFMRMDPRTLRAVVPLLYAAGIGALVAVLSPLGSTVNGSRSWIQLPGLSVQPAEIAKVSLALAIAATLADREPALPRAGQLLPGVRGRDHRNSSRQRRGTAVAAADLRFVLLVIALPLALIMGQPDLGSALVVCSLAACGLLVACISRKVVAGAAAAAGTLIALVLMTPVLATYQRNRLLAFLHPDADVGGIGYQVAQVKLAIGSGGWFGQGLFHGHSTQSGFIPYQYTDFVFSVAGEELGLVGAAGIVVLEMFLVVRMLVVASRAPDPFARVLCACLAGWFGFQSVENIGMNLGLMPVTGVPLPFVSYGGSSMFSCWIAIGLVGNVQLGRRSRLG